MAGLQRVRVDLTIEEYMDALLDAGSIGDLGKALSRLLWTFGYNDLVIFDGAKSAVVYSKGAGVRLQEPPVSRLQQILAHVRDADRPVTFRQIQQAIGLGAEGVALTWLGGGQGVMLCAPWKTKNSWFFRLSGAGPATGIGSAVLHVAAELAFRRYEELSQPKASVAPLTARERQVMRLLSSGRTDVDAARELRISPRTVRFHVDNAKRKLGVSSRAQAIVQALRAGHSLAQSGRDGFDRGWRVDDDGRIE